MFTYRLTAIDVYVSGLYIMICAYEGLPATSTYLHFFRFEKKRILKLYRFPCSQTKSKSDCSGMLNYNILLHIFLLFRTYAGDLY